MVYYFYLWCNRVYCHVCVCLCLCLCLCLYVFMCTCLIICDYVQCLYQALYIWLVLVYYLKSIDSHLCIDLTTKPYTEEGSWLPFLVGKTCFLHHWTEWITLTSACCSCRYLPLTQGCTISPHTDIPGLYHLSTHCHTRPGPGPMQRVGLTTHINRLWRLCF